MAFWWVNHKQTRELEVRGGYLWSPYRNANGAYNQTYENMKLAKVGDIVFSYAHGTVSAIGHVTATALPSPKPTEFGNTGSYWANEGWLVEVDFREVGKPLHPKQAIERIGPLLPERHSPLQRNGHGNQGCYLAAISDLLGHVLLAELDMQMVLEQDAPAEYRVDDNLSTDVLEDIHAVESDATATPTQRLQLAKARIGQGLFRKRVVLLEGACRVTGVSDTRLLVASHIKPWCESSNADRLNGQNGLLLSPHVDALFDDQWLTFEDDGRMHFNPSISVDVLGRWGIDPNKKVESFRPEQTPFLVQHRERFQRKLGNL